MKIILELPNFKTQLRRNNGTTLVVDELTNANGDIAEQEVVTYEQVTSNVWQQNTNFIFSGIDYNHNLISGIKALQNGRIDETILSQTDDQITEPSKAVVDAYTGIGIDHGAKTITISENRNLCELYDFAKANKVDNIQFPTPTTLTIQAQGNELSIGDYQLIVTGAAVISSCDKFLKVISTVTSSINDPNINLNIALTDAVNSYKLIRLTNIINGNVLITNQNSAAILAQETNYTGTYNLTTQNNSNDVSIVVSKDNFSNWAVTLDLTAGDIFTFQVNQSMVASSALLSKQEEILYLLRKVLQKNQAIQSVLNNNTVPVINLTSVMQTALYASEEKQDEMIAILKRVLSKTQAIRTTIDN